MTPIRIVKGVNHPTYTITWEDRDGTAVNLTGATITAMIYNSDDKTSTASTGTFALVTASSGIFSYIPSADDTDYTAGKGHKIQFKATFGDSTIDLTLVVPLWIEESL